MPRRPATVTKAALAQAIALVKDAHGAAEVIFAPDGTVRVTPATAGKSKPVDYHGQIKL
jgi:hypothetical protein